MKIIYSLCLAMLSLVMQAQVIGVNGAGFFENYSPQAEAWFKEAVKNDTFALRVPGGAIAKFATPAPDRGGWGLQYEVIDSIQVKYGSDEEEATADAIKKWHRKADQQPNYTYLEELIILQQEYPNMQVIWTANIFIPAADAIAPINYLVDNGVNIALIECGNETYSQVGYNFPLYISKAQPIIDFAKSKNIPVAHPVAALNRRETGSHTKWADALKNYTDYIIFHPYYDGREYSGLQQPVDTTLAFAQIAAWDFDAEFAALKNRFPNASGFAVTETNIQPSGLVGDTPLNAFFMQELLPAGKKAFDYFCIHSGIGPDKYALIYGTTTPKRNTTYYPFAAMFEEVTDVPDGGCDTTITYYTTYDTTYKYYQTIETVINETIVMDTLLPERIIYDTSYTFRQDTTYQTAFDSVIIYKIRNDKKTGYFKTNITTIQVIKELKDSVITSYTVIDTTIIKKKILDTVYVTVDHVETVITPNKHEAVTVQCDTIIVPPIDTTPQFQALDADTLWFSNETEFRDFLYHYGLARNYDVAAPKFNFEDRPEDVLPFKYMTNKAGNRVYTVDPAYYDVGVNEAEHYLNENLFAGKQYVVIFDHSGYAKQYREFYLEYCPQGDYVHVDAYITNPTNGQVVCFRNMFRWSDENGENIFNSNKKLWLLYGKDLPEKVYSFIPYMPDAISGCDFSFKEYTVGHETMELRFQGMNEKYGGLR